MHTYNTAPPPDELVRAQTELNQVKDIMVQNVEQILSRGERIELLVDKTDVMAGQATAFRRGARTVRRQMWWKNTKILALSVVVGLVSRSHCPLAYQNLANLDFTPSGPHVDLGGPVLRCGVEPMREQALRNVVQLRRTHGPAYHTSHPRIAYLPLFQKFLLYKYCIVILCP